MKNTIPFEMDNRNMKIAISSGKGGTGKTFVSTNLAVVLDEMGREVTYIDCDVEEPNGHLFMKPEIDHTEASCVYMPVEIDAERCTACGKCVEACKYNALAVVKDRVLYFPELCHACGACSIVCPEQAVIEEDRPVGKIHRIDEKEKVMEQKRKYQYLYGPVPSRRLGLSLGVDLVPYKTCSYSCIYCQLGKTPETTVERKEYIPATTIVEELRMWLEEAMPVDYITMSGSGEPTLNSRIGDIIQKTKSLTDIPVAVITNSSLFSNRKVREELAEADLVVPSLDAGSPGLFRYVNRPDAAVTFEDTVSGLISFSEEYRGELWVEVFLVYPANTLEGDLRDLKLILDRVNCSRIQLNTCVRPPAESFTEKAPPDKIRLALGILGDKAEVITPFEGHLEKEISGSVSKDAVLRLLKRRPCSLEDISNSLSSSPNEVLKYLPSLLEEGIIKTEDHGLERFYEIA